MEEKAVSVMEQLARELSAECDALVKGLKPELAEAPDASFTAWATGAGFDAKALWLQTRGAAAAANAEARATLNALQAMVRIVESAPRDLEVFTIRRSANGLAISVGNVTRSTSVCEHNEAIGKSETPVTDTALGMVGGQGLSGSRIRVTAAKKPEHQHLVGRVFEKTDALPALVVLGIEAGLYTQEQAASEKGAGGRRNKAAQHFGWVRLA